MLWTAPANCRARRRLDAARPSLPVAARPLEGLGETEDLEIAVRTAAPMAPGIEFAYVPAAGRRFNPAFRNSE